MPLVVVPRGVREGVSETDTISLPGVHHSSSGRWPGGGGPGAGAGRTLAALRPLPTATLPASQAVLGRAAMCI